ncbi:FAD-dependent oxidoreductase [Streptomyces antimicrobicus]|uniref:FAD-dependent monooxygenase n=1 Tax=Streptomyces antimicrobicus TaxID=2883108 RepID=A0ABS8B9F9_9ACTN|nr:FAD-dependent monooxygenase [Streptomyces antimicrobicus]MCB5181256.1 FAD-dependent monooxygenase [Streptomyces antimicrobicus]
MDDHVVVLGAGMAGLLAARVLAERFARVTLVERDAPAQDAPAFRPGLPQSRHVHVLWSRGVRLIDELLPGVTGEVLARGGRLLESPGDLLWLSPADWFGKVPGAQILVAGRELIDWAVRRAVLADPRITFRGGCEATGLVADAAHRAVVGVRVRDRGHDRGSAGPLGGEVVRASLVVDATGRTSKAPAWLAEAGWARPDVTRYDSHLAYSSRYFRAPPHDGRAWEAMYVQGRPDLPRGAVLVPQDGGRWLVTLVGNGRHAPPTRAEEFLGYARTLRSPALYDALREVEPLTAPTGFRHTANEWRHYERLADPPHGFVVIGDATCRFNPVYGHGMTVAALAARALREALAPLEPGEVPAASRRIQRRISATAAVAWQIATSEDLRYPETEGPAPDRVTRVLQQYMTRVMVAANTDPAVSGRFFGVLSLTESPNALLTPAVMLRVLSKWRLPAAPMTPDYPLSR